MYSLINYKTQFDEATILLNILVTTLISFVLLLKEKTTNTVQKQKK